MVVRYLDQMKQGIRRMTGGESKLELDEDLTEVYDECESNVKIDRRPKKGLKSSPFDDGAMADLQCMLANALMDSGKVNEIDEELSDDSRA